MTAFLIITGSALIIIIWIWYNEYRRIKKYWKKKDDEFKNKVNKLIKKYDDFLDS